MTRAYASVLDLSFEVRAGLFIRQVHHWAALVFVAAIVVHLARIFFTGAFRKPRDLNWYLGSTLLVLAIANGFAGYSLLDDLLSGTGLRIMFSLLESIPVVGTTLAFFAFGGDFPGPDIVGRLFVVHVLIVPAALGALIAAHLALVWHQKHTQFPGPGRTESNVVGTRLWPAYAVRSISLLFAVAAVLAGLGGLVQINPVWLYGPFSPTAATTAAQPDWYMGWMEGALRLMPPGDLHLGSYTVPNIFFPGVVLPGLSFLALYLWPVIERRFTHDRVAHNLLDRPRDRPWRTALGCGVFTFYVVLFVAGGDDVLAARLGLSVNAMVWVLRGTLIVLPILVGLLVHKWCRDLLAGEAALDDEHPDDDVLAPAGVAPAATGGHASTHGDGTGALRKLWRGLSLEGWLAIGMGAVAYVLGRILGRNHPAG
jgi:ubiquinol-cytochrome c reductase cytochrome b subunit